MKTDTQCDKRMFLLGQLAFLASIPDWNAIERAIRVYEVECYKSGMTKAADIARKLNDGHEYPVTREIEQARDALTEKGI